MFVFYMVEALVGRTALWLCYLLAFVLETGSPVAEANLKQDLYLKTAVNFLSFCLYLLHSVIACVCHMFCEVPEIDLGAVLTLDTLYYLNSFVLTLDTLYELNYIASTFLHHFLLSDVIETPDNINPTSFMDIFAEVFKDHTFLLFCPVFSG